MSDCWRAASRSCSRILSLSAVTRNVVRQVRRDLRAYLEAGAGLWPRLPVVRSRREGGASHDAHVAAARAKAGRISSRLVAIMLV